MNAGQSPKPSSSGIRSGRRSAGVTSRSTGPSVLTGRARYRAGAGRAYRFSAAGRGSVGRAGVVAACLDAVAAAAHRAPLAIAGRGAGDEADAAVVRRADAEDFAAAEQFDRVEGDA